MEGKPHIPTTSWTYSDMALDNMDNMNTPNFSDTAELTLPYTDPILHQVTQPVSQTGGAVGGTAPQRGVGPYDNFLKARFALQ